MKKSKDGTVQVLVGSDMGQVIFPPMGWSVINVPASIGEAKALFTNLFNSPTSHHLALAVSRHRKKDKLRGFASLGVLADSTDWKYLDSVSVLYEKPSSSSSNGLLPLSECGHLLYKGDSPDSTKTGWFNDGVGNATNFWDVEAVVELDGDKTYYTKFSAQLNLLLMSLSGPLEYRAFGYFCDVDKNELKNIHTFCRQMQLTACLYAENDSEATKVINIVDSLGE